MPTSNTQQHLANRAAIHDLHMRYFQGLDSNNLEQVKSCFSDDVSATYHKQAPVKGIEQLASRVFKPYLDDMVAHRVKVGNHFMGNLNFIQLQDDTAETEVYVFSLVVHANPGNEQVTVRCLRYIDQLWRGPDGWKIRDRIHALDWSGAMPATFAVTLAQRVMSQPMAPVL